MHVPNKKFIKLIIIIITVIVIERKMNKNEIYVDVDELS